MSRFVSVDIKPNKIKQQEENSTSSMYFLNLLRPSRSTLQTLSPKFQKIIVNEGMEILRPKMLNLKKYFPFLTFGEGIS